MFIGISFGTYHASIALIGNDGKAKTIANEDGHRQIPVAISFTDHGILTGSQTSMGNAFKNKIVEFRNILGKNLNSDQVVEQINRLPITLGNNEAGKLVYSITNMDENGNSKTLNYTPKELVSLYLTTLKNTAIHVSHLSIQELQGVVLSIPAHFEKNQVEELVGAAHDAGFEKVLTIKEPVAAALAFISQGSEEKDTCLQKDLKIVVLDLGGHQFNVSCLLYSSGLYSIVHVKEDESLGGVCFDKILAQHFSKEFYSKTKINVLESKRATSKLYAAAEITKRSLTRIDTAPCSIESLSDGLDFHGNMNRIRFEMLAEPLFQRALSVVKSALNEASWTTDDIDQVLFVGGSSRIPRFQSLMSGLFSKSVLRTDVEPDEATAIGCALHAQLLIKHPDFIKSLESGTPVETLATSKSIGVESIDGSFIPIILKETLLPCQRSIKINIGPDQNQVYMAIYEGNNPFAKKNQFLTSVCMDSITKSDKPGEIHLTLTLELDGSLTVSAKEMKSGKQATAVVS